MNRTLLFLTLALAGCGAPAPDAPAQPDSSHVLQTPPSSPGDSALAQFLTHAITHPGGTREEIMAKLGAPDSISARTVENRHNPEVTDSIFTLHHDGITIGIYRAGYDGKEILGSLQITSDAHLQESSAIRIGSSAEDVRALLGEPTSSSESELIYECDECLVTGHETLRFELAQGNVRAIHIQYWID